MIVMSACWPLQMPPTSKAVLMSLADNANDQGECWPSISTISERTCFSERAVQNAIHWLEANGALLADRSNGRHTRYAVTPDRFNGKASGEHHYIYRITHLPTGQFYIGSRSSATLPEQDDYYGSGSACEQVFRVRSECRREVIQVFESRRDANVAESALIATSIADQSSLNRKVSNPNNAGGNPRSKCTPQQMHPAADSATPAAPAGDPRSRCVGPLQQVPSNPKEPSSNRKSNRQLDVCLPSWLPENVWAEWVSHRAEIRKPLSQRAAELTIAKIVKLRLAGHDAKTLIENAIENGWQGIYAPRTEKPNANRTSGRKLSAVEQVEQAIRERRQRESDDDGFAALGHG
jgi:hypothetical protein